MRLSSKEWIAANQETLRNCRREHYQRNKQQYMDRNKEKRERIKEYVAEQKRKPCADCGMEYPAYVMDFDHRDPSEKEYQMGNIVNCGSWARVKREIEKCDVVCANCHRERTYGSMKRHPMFES